MCPSCFYQYYTLNCCGFEASFEVRLCESDLTSSSFLSTPTRSLCLRDKFLLCRLDCPELKLGMCHCAVLRALSLCLLFLKKEKRFYTGTNVHMWVQVPVESTKRCWAF